MYSIIMTTYNVPEYLKLCVDSILENSYYKTHQLFIHVNDYDKESIDYLKSKNVEYIATEDVGQPIGLNMCIDNVKLDNILVTNDDCYFTKNWDYYLHQWEIELNSRFPDYLKFIGCRWLEPNPGSFPPICDAGKNIKEFNIGKLNDYILKYSVHDIGEWFFNSLFPTEIMTKCKFSPEFSPISCVDIDHGMKITKYLKDNNRKFLMASVKDCCMYHFQRIARLKNKRDTDNSSLFEKKWNIDVGHAYCMLNEETRKSIKLIKGPEENQDIKDFVRKGYREILKRCPDPEGFNHYVKIISNGTLSKDRFLEILITSDEYKNKFANIN